MATLVVVWKGHDEHTFRVATTTTSGFLFLLCNHLYCKRMITVALLVHSFVHRSDRLFLMKSIYFFPIFKKSAIWNAFLSHIQLSDCFLCVFLINSYQRTQKLSLYGILLRINIQNQSHETIGRMSSLGTRFAPPRNLLQQQRHIYLQRIFASISSRMKPLTCHVSVVKLNS